MRAVIIVPPLSALVVSLKLRSELVVFRISLRQRALLVEYGRAGS